VWVGVGVHGRELLLNKRRARQTSEMRKHGSGITTHVRPSVNSSSHLLHRQVASARSAANSVPQSSPPAAAPASPFFVSVGDDALLALAAEQADIGSAGPAAASPNASGMVVRVSFYVRHRVVAMAPPKSAVLMLGHR
jgi:hypothetical protein